MVFTLFLDFNSYEGMGTHSLLGRFLEEVEQRGKTLTDIEEIEIIFRASTNEELRKRGGPEILLMPEFTPICLIKDILTLMESYKVTLRYEPRP